MDIKEKIYFGVPTPETVEYDKIYSYDSNVVNPAELFSCYLFNRGGREDAIQKHVNEIADAIVKNGGMEKMPPIVVDINTLQIPDGNCRFNAMKKIIANKLLDHVVLRVIYEYITPEDFDKRVIELNQGQKSWSTVDFIYNYSLRGNENYTRFIEFCESEETLKKKDGTINPRYAGAALCKSPNELKNSKLMLTDAEVEIGRMIIHEAEIIRDKINVAGDRKANGGGWYESFLQGWAQFRPYLIKEEIPFKLYLRGIQHQVAANKRENPVPYGSNRKFEWFSFFNNTLVFEFKK